MPSRFSAFPPDQATQLAIEVNRLHAAVDDARRRIVTVMIIGLILIASVAGVALYLYDKAETDAQHSLACTLTLAIPRRPVPGRTPAQQRNVDRFYHALAQRHILTLDSC
jgi:hypothetical protein